MYNSNTNNLIIVGAHLMGKKKQRVLCTIHFLDWNWEDNPNEFYFFVCFQSNSYQLALF